MFLTLAGVWKSGHLEGAWRDGLLFIDPAIIWTEGSVENTGKCAIDWLAYIIAVCGLDSYG